MTVCCKEERLSRLGEELDELCVVPRRDRREPRVGGGDEGGHGRFKQLAKWRPVVGQRSAAALRSSLLCFDTSQPGSCDGAAAEDVREDDGALHVRHDQREHCGELCLAEGVGEGAGPVDVIDSGVGVLVVREGHVFHGQQGQLVCSVWISTMLHVAGDCEQLA